MRNFITKSTKQGLRKWDGLQFVYMRKGGQLIGSISINGVFVPGVTASGSNKAEIRTKLLDAYIAKNSETGN